MIRLNKYITQCGVASRRVADKLIEQGAVKVNNKDAVIGMSINPNKDKVTVYNTVITPIEEFTYIKFNKPKGCVTTMKDDKEGRRTIYDYLTDIKAPHLVPIGRLDYDTEGLLLLTNNGELVNALTHPSHEVPKTYQVKIEGELLEHEMAKLRKGVEIEVDGVKIKTKKCSLNYIETKNNISKYEITIREGKNRQVRKMFAVVGKEVLFLRRVSIGHIRLGGVARGCYRELTPREIDLLLRY